MNARIFFKCAAIAACTICILATLPFFYLLPARLDPQGDKSDACVVEKIAPILNESHSVVASAHQTFCTDIIHDAAVYIYLHKPNENDSTQSLIFRYSDDPGGSLPKVSWNDDSHLSISVGEILQITKMVTALNGISIKYSVKGVRTPNDAWAAQIRNLELVAAGVALFVIMMLSLIAVLIRSIRRDHTRAQTH